MTSQVVSSVASSLLVGGPVPHASRQGRHRQRYGEGGERLLAGCIPVRMSGCPQKPQHVRVCMITTTSGTGLVFPKGGWEDDESVECAAQRETVEEAGVRGELEEPLLGIFSFASGKAESSQADAAAGAGGAGGRGEPRGGPAEAGAASGAAAPNASAATGNGNGGASGNGNSGTNGGVTQPSGRCKAYIYVMHVAEELPCWPESKDRQRVWCSIPEASRLCKHQWMREALRVWVRRKGWEDILLLLDQQQQQQQQGAAATAAAAAGNAGRGTTAGAATAATANATARTAIGASAAAVSNGSEVGCVFASGSVSSSAGDGDGDGESGEGRDRSPADEGWGRGGCGCGDNGVLAPSALHRRHSGAGRLLLPSSQPRPQEQCREMAEQQQHAVVAASAPLRQQEERLLREAHGPPLLQDGLLLQLQQRPGSEARGGAQVAQQQECLRASNALQPGAL